MSAKAKVRGLSSAQPQTNGGLENAPSVSCATELDNFPVEWRVERLGNSCRIMTGKKDVNEGSSSGKYPFFTCSKAIHYSNSYSFDTEAILVAGNGAVGETKYYRGKFEAYQRTYVLDQFSAFAPYVFLFLKGTLVTKLARHITGSTMPYIRRGDLENIEIPVPPLPEQRRIASVLGAVQRAMEQQERLLALTAELKKALLHQLFTVGLRGEPQKQTDIGPVPQSWEVATLEDAAIAFDYGTSVKCEHGKAGVAVLRIPNVVGGSIDLTDLKHGQPKRSELNDLSLKTGDLLFVRTNGVLENAGRCALYRGELEGCYFASYLIRVRVDSSKVLPAFVNEYARTERGRSFLSGRAIRTADGKFNINSGTLKRVLLPLPSLGEQEEIVRQLDLVERKLKLHERKQAALTALFRTLLHQLMTAQIRVHDLSLDGL